MVRLFRGSCVELDSLASNPLMFEKHSNALYIVMKNGSKNGSSLPGSGSWSLHIVAAPGAASRRPLPKSWGSSWVAAPKERTPGGGPRPQRRSLGTPRCGQSCLAVVGRFQSWWWMAYLRHIYVICGISWPGNSRFS